MDRVIATNSVPFAAADRAPASGTPQYFTVGNPATPVPATVVPGYFLNMIQDEIRAVITRAGLIPDDTNWAQLAAAIPILVNNSLPGQYTLTAGGIATALGYTPVQQGTGVGQLGNALKLGWSGSRVKATVDATDQGSLAMLSDFISSATNPGYIFWPGGLVLQFLRGVTAQTNGAGLAQYNWTFPYAYPTAVLGYSFTCGNELIQYVMQSSNYGVSNAGMSILGQINAQVAGNYIGFSGFVIGH